MSNQDNKAHSVERSFMQDSVVLITDQNFGNEVKESTVPVLVDFGADWCMPCKMIAPLVGEVSQEYKGKLKVGKMDVDNNTGIATDLGIMNIPTLIIFKNGEELDRIVGVISKNQLKEKIEKALF